VLFRLFPKKNYKTPSNEQTRTHENPKETLELKVEINRLKTELSMSNAMVDELKSDKAYLQGELSKTTTLLSDLREKSSQSTVQKQKKFLGIFPYKND
jgi:predicted  nucleic acid-binding Zn-ribbon protein